MNETNEVHQEVLGNLIAMVLIGAGIYGIGRVLHRSVGRDHEIRFEHGRFIPAWVAGTYLTLGLGSQLLIGLNVDASYVAGQLASFGILIGLGIGWIHGSIRIRTPQQANSIDVEIERDDLNPYRPPVNGGLRPRSGSGSVVDEATKRSVQDS